MIDPRADVIGMIESATKDEVVERTASTTLPSRRGWPSCPIWKRVVQRLNIDGDGQGDLIWETERFERLWIATGPPPMRTTSRTSTRFTVRTRCSNIPNRASASAGGRGRHKIQSSRAAQPNRKRF